MISRFYPGRRMVLRSVLAAGLAAFIGFSDTSQALADSAVKLDQSWLVSADSARQMIAAGAVVLDARDPSLQKKEPLPGATNAQWMEFSKEAAPPAMGLLADDAILTEKFQAMGVSADTPVIAIGDTLNGWGEDGRIVWTLRSRGHKGAVIVDGGYHALVADGMPEIKAPDGAGDWVAVYDDSLEATAEEVKIAMDKPNVVILDVREPREFEGKTPYGESRGGHVPGAKHLYYKDFFGEDGKLLEEGALRDKLASLGVSADSEVIAYCTGGVRSGYFTGVLQNIGIKTQNYAGSMWDWSSKPEAEFPLTTE